MKNLWKARLAVGLIMLILAFIGMVITDVYQGGSWDYWKWVVPVYAILAIGLSAYVRKQTDVHHPATLWQEALHWLGLIGAIFLVSHFSAIGIMSRFLLGITQLTLVSLAVFLAGVYIESIFLLIGAILGLFAFLAAVFVQYIYAVSLPILIGAAILLVLWIWLSHRKQSPN